MTTEHNAMAIKRSRTRRIREFEIEHNASADHQAAVFWHGSHDDGSRPECLECFLEKRPETWVDLEAYAQAYNSAHAYLYAQSYFVNVDEGRLTDILRDISRKFDAKFRIRHNRWRDLVITTASPEDAVEAAKLRLSGSTWDVRIEFRMKG